jgi:hypothetical protein
MYNEFYILHRRVGMLKYSINTLVTCQLWTRTLKLSTRLTQAAWDCNNLKFTYFLLWTIHTLGLHLEFLTLREESVWACTCVTYIKDYKNSSTLMPAQCLRYDWTDNTNFTWTRFTSGLDLSRITLILYAGLTNYFRSKMTPSIQKAGNGSSYKRFRC